MPTIQALTIFAIIFSDAGIHAEPAAQSSWLDIFWALHTQQGGYSHCNNAHYTVFTST